MALQSVTDLLGYIMAELEVAETWLHHGSAVSSISRTGSSLLIVQLSDVLRTDDVLRMDRNLVKIQLYSQ